MTREHHYRITTTWTGNLGTGTSDYRAYSRNHEIKIAGKSAPLAGSSDAAFRGDPSRYTPEELLVASLSACHMLWFLHLCADAGIAVTEYEDAASGDHERTPADGSGEFTRVVLRPRAVITDSTRIADAMCAPPPGPSAVLHCPLGELPGDTSRWWGPKHPGC